MTSERWRTFWFAAVPQHLFSLLRIVLAAIGLVQLVLVRDIAAFWAPDGIMPGGAHSGISAWLLAHDLSYSSGLLILTAEGVCLAAMLVGYQSRAAVALVFFGALFQGWWNRLPQYGGYSLWRDLVFCLVWANTGRVWSLDNWLRAADDTSLDRQPVWPLRLMRFQVALMYFTSGLWKVLDPSWQDGSALHYILNDPSFTRFPWGYPAVLESVLPLAVYLTLIWELTFPFMLWHRRTRQLTLIAGVLIHLAMWMTLDVQLFAVVVFAGYLAFLDPYAFSQTIKVLPRRGFVRAPI